MKYRPSAGSNRFTEVLIPAAPVIGLIVDVDECIAYNHMEILNENKEYLNKLSKEGIKIVLFSNMEKNSRYDDLESFLHVLTNVPPKPEPAGFIKALKILDLNAEEVVMIGDNYLTDGGAIQLGIDFIKIKPIKTKHEKKLIKLKRIPDKFLRLFISKLSQIYEVFGI